MNEETQYRLGNGSVAIFLAAAGFADALTFVPALGDFVDPIFWGCALFYLWHKGLGLVNGKRIAVETISFVAELIPGVQELPTIFIAAVAIVVMSRTEDKTGIKIPGKGSTSRPHLNHNGVRLPETNTTTATSRPKGRITTYNGADK
jgi:hypothetical protein